MGFRTQKYLGMALLGMAGAHVLEPSPTTSRDTHYQKLSGRDLNPKCSCVGCGQPKRQLNHHAKCICLRSRETKSSTATGSFSEEQVSKRRTKSSVQVPDPCEWQGCNYFKHPCHLPGCPCSGWKLERRAELGLQSKPSSMSCSIPPKWPSLLCRFQKDWQLAIGVG